MFSFIETHLFTRLVTQHLSDEQYTKLQLALISNPKLGYVRRPKGVIWMLTMYPKNMADSIPAHGLKEIREELGDE